MDNATAPTIDQLLAQHARRQNQRSPTRSVSSHTSIPQPNNSGLRCCCGNDACTYLRSGKDAISGLERDVKAAATIGQALLARHETYVADAEQERTRMKSSIDELEIKNNELEETNSQVVEENKVLVVKVDELNTTIAEADEHIKSLTATLSSTQEELQKLSVLASRTQILETQLYELEQEQTKLQETLISTKEEARSAQQQWRTSQRKVMELLDQMDAIEKEARDERVRHAEVVEQFKKKQFLIEELNIDGLSPEELIQQDGKKGVVSSFVKGLLEDNAKLSLNMVELRELLNISNEQVEELREQMTVANGVDKSSGPNLSTELKAEATASQAVHVHHHYHAATNPPHGVVKNKSQPYQRPRRKRQQVITSGRSTPRSSVSYGPPSAFHRGSESSIASPESPPRSNRWSRSSFAPSTVPSSPRSNGAPSTIFSRALADDVTEYSRPTSPESSGPWSPSMLPLHKKNASEDFQSLSLPSKTHHGFTFTSNSLALPPIEHDEEEDEKEITPRELEAPDVESCSSPRQSPIREVLAGVGATSPPESSKPKKEDSPTRPGLKRSNSHASLISVSGMDIHSSFPSPMPSVLRPNLRTTPSQSSTAIVTTESAQAFRSGTGTRNILEKGLNRNLGRTVKTEDRYTPLMDTFGTKVGGWITSRWTGPGTKPSLENVQETSSEHEDDSATKAGSAAARLWFLKSKKPPPQPKGPRNVEVSPLDEEALMECLVEEENEL